MQDLDKTILSATAALKQEMLESMSEEKPSKKQILKNFYRIEKQVVNTTCDWIEKRFEIKIENREKIEINDLFFNKDDKTLEERIDKLLGIKREKTQIILAGSLIIDTEIYHCMNLISIAAAAALELPVIVIVEPQGCDICMSASGEYLEGDVPQPPYHPGCRCTLDFYDEITPDLLNENYVLLLDEALKGYI